MSWKQFLTEKVLKGCWHEGIIIDEIKKCRPTATASLKGESMKIRKLYHPKTLKFCLELWIGWRSLKLTGFWFTDRIGK